MPLRTIFGKFYQLTDNKLIPYLVSMATITEKQSQLCQRNQTMKNFRLEITCLTKRISKFSPKQREPV